METIELSFIIPGQVPQLVPLDQGTMMVGTLLSNHVVLRAIGVEPIHALIEQEENGTWKVTDLGSDSGVSVNGNKIDVEFSIKVGDIITIGSVNLTVKAANQIAMPVGGIANIPDPRISIIQEPSRDHPGATIPPGITVPAAVGLTAVETKQPVANTLAPSASSGETVSSSPSAGTTVQKESSPSRIDQYNESEKESSNREMENKSLLFSPKKSKPGGEVLEGVAYWGDTILEVEHFSLGNKGFEEVTIGDPTKAHFIAAGKSNLIDYTLAKVSSDGYSLRLKEGMEARLRRQGKVEKAGVGSHELGKRDIAHIKYGAVKYFLLFVTPPNVVLPRSGPKGPFVGMMAALSVFYVALIVGLWTTEPKHEEKDKDDIWSIVHAPETMRPKPKPEVQPKEKKPEIKLAEVKKPPEKKTPPPPKPKPVKPAKPIEKEKVKQPEPVEKPVEKPSPIKALNPPTPKKPPKPQNQTQPQPNSGLKGTAGMPSTGAKNPDFKLAGAKVPGKSLGASGGAKGSGMGAAGGQRKGTGQTNVKGVEGVDNNKASGVNLGKLGIGAGKVLSKTGAGAIRTDFKSSAGGGGGGSGTGTRNLGMGGLGTGKSIGLAGTGSAVNNFGQGSGGLLSGQGGSGGNGGSGLGNSFGRGQGGRSQVRINIPVSAPAVSGGLTSQEVMAVIRTHLNEIRHCYEQLLQRSPSASGKINTKFMIQTNGRVSSADVLNSTISDGRMQSCVVGKIQRWKFPNPRGGKPVTITYPFVFNPL